MRSAQLQLHFQELSRGSGTDDDDDDDDSSAVGQFPPFLPSYHFPHLMLLMKAVGAETLWELNVYDGRWEGSLIVLFI